MLKAFLVITTIFLTSLLSFTTLANCEQQDQNIAYKNTREFIRIKKVVNSIGNEKKKITSDLKKQIKSLFNRNKKLLLSIKVPKSSPPAAWDFNGIKRAKEIISFS